MKRMDKIDKDIVDLLSGDTIVYDENGNRVPLLHVAGFHIVRETTITSKELIEAYGKPFDFLKKVFEQE